MSRITYLSPGEEPTSLEVADGVSVMRAAINEGVRGILGECGGQAMCATCHVYVEEVDGELPEPGEDEEEMLECAVAPRLEESRLGCQLLAGDFAAITVRLPERQV